MNKIKLSDNLEVYDTPTDFLYKKLDSFEYFSFMRLTHGYWQAVLDNGHMTYYVDQECFSDIETILSIIHTVPNFYLGVDHGGNEVIHKDYQVRLDRCDEKDKKQISKLIKNQLPSDYIPYNGQFWRNLALSKELIKFVKVFKKYHIIYVADSFPRCLNLFFQQEGISFFQIHPTHSWLDRYEILSGLKILDASIDKDKPRLFLFKSSFLSLWLTWYLVNDYNIWTNFLTTEISNFLNKDELSKPIKHATFIDIGRAFDVFDPNAESQFWIQLGEINQYYAKYWI